MKKSPNKFDLALSILIVLIAVSLMAGIYFRLFRLHIIFGDFFYHHWATIIGTSLIAIYTILYPTLKRRYPKNFKTLQRVHVFGNLLAVMLVSIHFTTEIIRPPQSRPEFSTGIILYPTMFLLVLTGFLRRFPVRRGIETQLKFVHVGLTLTFYSVIVVHVLHGLGFL